MYYDTPRDYIGDVYEELIFGDHPLGWNRSAARRRSGTPRARRSSTTSATGTSPRGWSSASAGLIEGDLSGDRGAARRPRRGADRRARAGSRSRPTAHTRQAPLEGLRPGAPDPRHPSYPIVHPDRYALQLLALVLGSGMSSRLFTEVRERRGLAYYVFATNYSYTDAGTLFAQAGVDLKRIDEAVDDDRPELRRIVDEPVGADELEKAQLLREGTTHAPDREPAGYSSSAFAARCSRAGGRAAGGHRRVSTRLRPRTCSGWRRT